MSFRQDRTNPSTAVSNWKGRSETPKGHPSTRVSQWINGGLFGGGGADTWFSIYSFESAFTASYGAGYPILAKPWAGAKNTPLTSDGSVTMMAQANGGSDWIYYQMSPSGVVAPDAAKIGAYSVTNGEWQAYGFTTNGTDLLLNGGYGKYTPDSAYRVMPGVVAAPLSVTNTSGTPTIEDFKVYNINGSSWNTDRFRSLMVYTDDIAGSNTVYWCAGGKPQGSTGWVYGTYDTSSDALACTGFGRTYGSDWDNQETDWTVQGPSGRMYGFVKGTSGSASVFMSDATSESSSHAFQKMYAQAWAKPFTYTSYGQCFGAYPIGQYSGNDQFIVMFSAQQLYGGAETYIAKMTPFDGNVQATSLIYASNGQGEMKPPDPTGASTGMCMDSSNNIYIVMGRSGLNSNQETVVMKLDSDLVVQWTRVMQMSDSNTFGTVVSGTRELYPGGINLTADEQYLMVHGMMEYYPNGGQRKKGFAFRVKADGSGAMPNDGNAHQIGSSGLTPTVSNSYSETAYIRYYDPADTSASTPRPVNVSSLSGNWGSASANGNTNFGGNQGAANGPDLSSNLANKSTIYGNYVYENTFAG